jgi:hypothetical protein
MLSKSLKIANLTFEYLEVYLSMCEWSLEQKCLCIVCTTDVAESVYLRLNSIDRWFGGLEQIQINGSVAFEQVIPVPIVTESISVSDIYRCVDQPSELWLPVLTISEGMKVTPEMMAIMFPKP